jgi:phytanoyl-CoA hydroxylase
VGDICRQIPIENPVVVQSMAILKPPKIGGNVSVHQDSTFLYDEPETLVGFWIPLQDATVKNGCLWGIPGSHKYPLY